MPAYHQIETYFLLRDGLEPVKQRLLALYRDLGWDTPELTAWIQELIWVEQDDGWVDTGSPSPRLSITLGSVNVPIRPIAMGWTQYRIPQLPAPCLAWEVLIESHLIEEHIDQGVQYHPAVITAVWALMERIGAHQPDYGVFFTDEVRDGQAWFSILGDGQQAFWSFELAMIEQPHWPLYEPHDPTFVRRDSGRYRWLAPASLAADLPWEGG